MMQSRLSSLIVVGDISSSSDEEDLLESMRASLGSALPSAPTSICRNPVRRGVGPQKKKGGGKSDESSEEDGESGGNDGWATPMAGNGNNANAAEEEERAVRRYVESCMARAALKKKTR